MEKIFTGVWDHADPRKPWTLVKLGTMKYHSMTLTTLASAAQPDTSPRWFGRQAQRLALALHQMGNRSMFWPDTLHLATVEIMKETCWRRVLQERTEDLAGDLVLDLVDLAPVKTPMPMDFVRLSTHTPALTTGTHRGSFQIARSCVDNAEAAMPVDPVKMGLIQMDGVMTATCGPALTRHINNTSLPTARRCA